MTIVSFLFLIGFTYLITSTVRYFIMLSRWDGGKTENPFTFGDFSAPKVETRQVTKAPHPELTDVKPGTELMGVSFDEKPTSCDLEEYQALQARIEELKSQLNPDDEDDDDDDGDVPALIKR